MKKYPRVGILCPISHNIPPCTYGPWELVCYNLSESLVKLGVDVTIFATKKAKTSAKLEYAIKKPFCDFEKVDETALTNIHIIDALKKAKKVDIIHNNLNITPVLYSQFIDTPMVTTLHGAAVEKQNADYYSQLKKSNYISISYAERSFFPSLNYIDNVYNGVDFSLYPLSNSKKSYFVFSGRIVKEKGILSAIKIAQKTKIPLKIAGIVTNQEFFDTQVKPHIDGVHISFLGNLVYSQLISLLQDAVATLCLVEWNEPFGLSALDSLACGVPVIATNMGAFPELIYDNNMGTIVKDADEAIERLSGIRTVNAQKCRELAQAKFSREVMAKRYLDSYIKLA